MDLFLHGAFGFKQNVVSRDDLAPGFWRCLRSRAIYGLLEPPVVSNVAVLTAFTIYPLLASCLVLPVTDRVLKASQPARRPSIILGRQDAVVGQRNLGFRDCHSTLKWK
jgi:hypothetical protein